MHTWSISKSSAQTLTKTPGIENKIAITNYGPGEIEITNGTTNFQFLTPGNSVVFSGQEIIINAQANDGASGFFTAVS